MAKSQSSKIGDLAWMAQGPKAEKWRAEISEVDACVCDSFLPRDLGRARHPLPGVSLLHNTVRWSVSMIMLAWYFHPYFMTNILPPFYYDFT
jgi:hypothetical protein